MQDPTIGPNSRLAEFRNKVLKSQNRYKSTVTLLVPGSAAATAHKDRFPHH